jgi:7 transmembrane receptor (rhodopsin family)
MASNLTSPIIGSLTRDNPAFWRRPTPLDCGTIRTTGIFLCLAAFVGILLNGALVYSFVRYSALRTAQNIFIMFIALIGLIASLCTVPLTGASSIYCHWLFSRTGCQFEAVMAFLYGCSSSYLLCAVSLTRCYIIMRPFDAKKVTVCYSLSLPVSVARERCLGVAMCRLRECRRARFVDMDVDANPWLERVHSRGQ